MIAIVTGASSGIGREFVKQIAASGEVDGFWLIARREERLREVAESVDLPSEIISADLASLEGLETVRALLEEKKPEVKILINAAGFGKFGNYLEMPMEEALGMIDLNVRALVYLTQTTLPYMVKGGYLIQMGSASCFTPLPNFNVYAAGKSFVLHYSKALAFETKSRGISVTCFCPGWVDTEFLGVAVGDDRSGPRPEKFKPLLKVDRVVAKALRSARRGKVMCVTNWFTKMQHVMFKLLPDRWLTKMWMTWQKK